MKKTKHKAPAPGAVATEMPAAIAPQLVRLAVRPSSSDIWQYEMKFDGFRIMVRIDGPEVRFFTRNGHDWTARLPELQRAFERQPLTHAWLDAEAVVLDDSGMPCFSLLEKAFDRRRTKDIVLYVFDLLYLDGWDLRSAILDERRRILAERLTPSEAVRLSETLDAPAKDLFASACAMGLEGIVGKRRDSKYTSTRDGSWIKLKCMKTSRFVVGGYRIGERATAESPISALLLGQYEPDGSLRYAGRVGTGFTAKAARDMRLLLSPNEQAEMPFGTFKQERSYGRSAEGQTRWVTPTYEIDVCYVELTNAGHIRHGSVSGAKLIKRGP